MRDCTLCTYTNKTKSDDVLRACLVRYLVVVKMLDDENAGRIIDALVGRTRGFAKSWKKKKSATPEPMYRTSELDDKTAFFLHLFREAVEDLPPRSSLFSRSRIPSFFNLYHASHSRHLHV